MKNSKIILISIVAALALSFSFSAKADMQELSGYIYSDNAGWISLNCNNTASCDKVAYSVNADTDGSLSGYGFSQTEGWINFNPNYGGVNIDSTNKLSGWAFSEKSGWLQIDGEQAVPIQDLKNQIASAQDTITKIKIQPGSLADSGLINSLHDLYNQFLSLNGLSAGN